VSRVLEAVLGTIGLAAVGFAILAITAPGELESVVPIQALAETTPIADGSARAIGFAIGGAICAVWVVWTAGTDHSKQLSGGSLSPADIGFRTLREAPPEHTNAATIVGGEFDESVATAANNATNGDEDDPIREDVRSLVVTVVSHTEGCSTSEAESIVEAGGWTGDAVAAAYVADEEAALSIRYRVLAWLRPSRTKRDRVRRAIRAIDGYERRVE